MGINVKEYRQNRRKVPAVDNSKFMHLPRDQFPMPACVGFAYSSLAEFEEAKRIGRLQPRLSPMFLWWLFRDPPKDRRVGSEVAKAPAEFINNGVCLETLWPWDNKFTHPDGSAVDLGVIHDWENEPYVGTFTNTPSGTAFSDAAKRKFFSQVNQLTYIDEITQELHNGKVLILTLKNYPDGLDDPNKFFYDDKSVIKKFKKEGHTMLIVGYLPDYPKGEVFKIRNSSGTVWGNRGYCYFTPALLAKLAPLILAFESRYNLPSPPSPKRPRGYPKPIQAVQPTQRTSGRFVYQWWIFNSQNEFNYVRAHRLAPNHVQYGKKIGNLSNTTTGKGFKIRNKDIKQTGKFLALGAADINALDVWMWTSTKLVGISKDVDELKKDIAKKKDLLNKIRDSATKVGQLTFKYESNDPSCIDLLKHLEDLTEIYAQELNIVDRMNHKRYKKDFHRAIKNLGEMFLFMREIRKAITKANAVNVITNLESSTGINKGNFATKINEVLKNCGKEIRILSSL
jgi:hypothetical protein